MHFMKTKWNTWIIGEVYVHMMYVHTWSSAPQNKARTLDFYDWSISFKDKFSNEDIMAAMLSSTPKADLKAHIEEVKHCFLKERQEIKQSIIFLPMKMTIPCTLSNC